MFLTLDALLALLVVTYLLIVAFPAYISVPDTLQYVALYDESTVAMELGKFDQCFVGFCPFPTTGGVCVTRYYFWRDGRLYEINYCTS